MGMALRISNVLRKVANVASRAWRRYQVFVERGTPTSPLVQEETECSHCGHVFRGNYCPRCGQNLNVGKGKPKFVKTFREAYPQLSNNFVRTMIHLVLRPGYMVRDYFLGHRVVYQNPINAFIVAISIITLCRGITNQVMQKETHDASIVENFSQALEDDYQRKSKNDKKMYAAYSKWKQEQENPQSRLEVAFDVVVDYLSSDTMISLFFLFPVLGITSFLVLRKRPFHGRRLTVTEHYLFFTYLYSSAVVLLDDYFLLTFLYMVWAYRGLYGMSWRRALWTTFVVVSIVVLIITVVLVSTVLLFYSNIAFNYA